MAWPTDNISKANLDQATDDPSLARADLENALQLIKEIIAGRATASGVCDLDSSSQVPTARLPTIPTAKLPSTHTKNAANGIPGLDGSGNITLNGFDVPYDERRVALGGDFNADTDAVIVRVGNKVTVTLITNDNGAPIHSSSSEPTSASGVIPAGLRPPWNASDVVQCEPASTSNFLAKMEITPTGSVKLIYFDWAGALVSKSGSSDIVSMDYNLSPNIA